MRWIAAVAAAALLAPIGFGSVLYLTASTSNIGDLEFENELAIPPLLDSRKQDGRKIVDLTLERGTSELVPGSRDLGHERPYLGRASRSRELHRHGDGDG